MSAIKRFGEEVSVLVGDEGELTKRSKGIASIAMCLCANEGLKKGDFTDKNQEFVEIVKTSKKLYEDPEFYRTEKASKELLAQIAYDALERLPNKTEMDEIRMAALRVRFPFMISSTRVSKNGPNNLS